MKSKHVLSIHTAIFVLFVLGSISSPILAIYFSSFFSSIFYLLAAVLIMAGVILSWRAFGGCPFTVWENRLRERESLETYLGSCLPHYSRKWFDLKLPGKFFTVILISLLLLPICTGIFVRFII
jgi:hypothetical protein